MAEGTLYWTTWRCSAGAALDAVAGDLTVLVSTPTEYVVAVRRDGVLQAPGRPTWTVPATCFQLTGFDGEREVRWLADGDDGDAVWLAETLDALPAGDRAELAFVDRLPQRALLWGQSAGDADGAFSRWTAARIGTAHYPVAPGSDADRVMLGSVEYVACDDHGNAGVVETRLTGLTVEPAGAS